MISATSRYADSATVLLSTPSGPRQVIVSGTQAAYTFTYVSHQITAADRIDLLADSYYGDATQWWAIADANPELLDWNNVPIGKIIRVPNV